MNVIFRIELYDFRCLNIKETKLRNKKTKNKTVEFVSVNVMVLVSSVERSRNMNLSIGGIDRPHSSPTRS